MLLVKDHGVSCIICTEYITARHNLRFEEKPEMRSSSIQIVLGLGELIGDEVLIILVDMGLIKDLIEFDGKHILILILLIILLGRFLHCFCFLILIPKTFNPD